jgi:hypothetical protein
MMTSTLPHHVLNVHEGRTPPTARQAHVERVRQVGVVMSKIEGNIITLRREESLKK